MVWKARLLEERVMAGTSKRSPDLFCRSAAVARGW